MYTLPPTCPRRSITSTDFPAAFAKALVQVTAPGETPLDGFLVLLHSASSPRAAEIGREWISRGHQTTLEQMIGGPLSRERAAIALALVAGLQVMRQMMEMEALAGAAPADLEAILIPLVRELFKPA